jgi:hypothetical protein
MDISLSIALTRGSIRRVIIPGKLLWGRQTLLWGDAAMVWG